MGDLLAVERDESRLAWQVQSQNLPVKHSRHQPDRPAWASHRDRAACGPIAEIVTGGKPSTVSPWR